MQSHQSSFGEQIHSANSHGHRRRPSLGKSMPVTSLLLNFPPPSSSGRNYSSLSRDGLSPEYERPPIFFNIHEGSDSENSSTEENEATKDFKKKNSKVKCSDSCMDANESKMSSIGNSTFYTPCLTCKTSANDDSPLTQLCHRLCTKECCEILSHTSQLPPIPKTSCPSVDKLQLLQRPPTRIEIQRKNFLADMLYPTTNDSGCISGDLKQEDVVVVPELIEIISNIMEDQHSEQHSEQLDSNNSSSVITPQESATLKDFREKFTIAEALAKTSAMTSPAVKRRLAARKVEMDLEYEENERRLTGNAAPTVDSKVTEIGSDYEPPRDLLLYLVRMGSFNSAPKINNIDSQDDSLELPQTLSTGELLQHIKQLRGENQPQLLTRYFLKPSNTASFVSNEISEGLRFLKLNSVSKVCSAPLTAPNHIRLLQWNILSQTLGQNNDGFVRCPEEALTWDHRKFLIVQEILQNNPDVVCLQEVDHYKFLENVLGSQNYAGIFFPKPDSPCLYIEENNGPDGCAIFYKRDKFELKNFETHILEVWRVQSNQVAIAVNLEIKATGREICVCTTHLKARHGSLLSKLRNEQGKDLIRFVKNFAAKRPILMCGDFNAEPIEPVYSTILSSEGVNLSSAYSDIKKELGQVDSITKNSDTENDKDMEMMESYAELSAIHEPPYTTWKIREDGEVCHTIDYVFYSKHQLKVKNCLEFPQGDEIGTNRTPSYQYPSDHFSLVCDFELIDTTATDEK